MNDKENVMEEKDIKKSMLDYGSLPVLKYSGNHTDERWEIFYIWIKMSYRSSLYKIT